MNFRIGILSLSFCLGLTLGTFAAPAALATPVESLSAASETPHVTNFIIVSDLHYNGSNQDDTPSQSRQDSNQRSIQLALASAHANCPNPAFVLCLGDILAHHNRRPDTYSPILEQSNVMSFFHDEFPNTTVYTVLGNNDSDSNPDSNTDADNTPQPAPFLEAFAKNWSTLILDQPNRQNFAATFSTHGWYVVNLPGLSKCKLVGLNSTYFEWINSNPPESDLATAQLEFLGKQIRFAKTNRETLWLAFHVPPGLNPYKDGPPFWNGKVQSNFLSMLGDPKNANVVTAIFCGHTHRDEFRILSWSNSPVAFVHIVPAISPCYDNNPAYQIFKVDADTHQILDYSTYDWPPGSVPPPRPFEYSFVTNYNLSGFSLTNLVRLEHRLTNELTYPTGLGTYATNFEWYYSASNTNWRALAPKDFAKYLSETLVREP